MLDQVIHLLSQSETHKDFNVEQISRCIIPPVNLQQCAGLFEDGYLTGWCSWAYLSEEKADIFLEGNYKIQPDDWRSGNVLVFMDFVAPFGNFRNLYTLCRSIFPKNIKVSWRRHTKQRRVVGDMHG